MSENEVLDAVEAHIRQHQPRNYHLNVLRNGVRRDGDWWYIVVQPDQTDVSVRDYAMVMEQVGSDLEAENIKVLLVPALPGD